ncbi:MAG TPA: hypothetical protein VF516_42920 [Kofleriaceae bacterium]
MKNEVDGAVEDERGLGSAEAAGSAKSSAKGLLEVRNGVKVRESGGVQDPRAHGSTQAAEHTGDEVTGSAMAGAAADEGLRGSAGAAGYLE